MAGVRTEDVVINGRAARGNLPSKYPSLPSTDQWLGKVIFGVIIPSINGSMVGESDLRSNHPFHQRISGWGK